MMSHAVGCRTYNTGCDGDCDCRSFADLDMAIACEMRSAEQLARIAALEAALEEACAIGLGLFARGELQSQREMAAARIDILRKLTPNTLYPGLFDVQNKEPAR